MLVNVFLIFFYLKEMTLKMDSMEEKTTKRTMIYKGKIIQVAKDQVKLPDGKLAERELVFHPGAVAMLPITKQNEIILVKQYRKAIEECLWEIPAGKIELDDDDILLSAKRELEEEIGMTGDFVYLTEAYTSPGFANEKITIYQVNNLQKVKNPKPQDEDENLIVKTFALDSLPAINDAKTLIAIQRLKLKLQGDK